MRKLRLSHRRFIPALASTHLRRGSSCGAGNRPRFAEYRRGKKSSRPPDRWTFVASTRPHENDVSTIAPAIVAPRTECYVFAVASHFTSFVLPKFVECLVEPHIVVPGISCAVGGAALWFAGRPFRIDTRICRWLRSGRCRGIMSFRSAAAHHRRDRFFGPRANGSGWPRRCGGSSFAQ